MLAPLYALSLVALSALVLTPVYQAPSFVSTITAQKATELNNNPYREAFVGRVAMDHPTGTPDFYRDHDAVTGIDASRRSIADITAIDAGRDLVRPIITPRFAPACTDEMLAGLGRLADGDGAEREPGVSEGGQLPGVPVVRW